MRRIALAAALALATTAAAADKTDDGHAGHAYAPPPVESLDTRFALRDTAGRLVRSEDLNGRWTLMYFGYSRCTTSCPVALPLIVEAARRLNARGAPTRAVFVDIDAPAAGIRPRNPGRAAPVSAHVHTSQTLAAHTSELAQAFGPSLLVLSGTRLQVNSAVASFRVLRQHMPARPGEDGHSINHSTLIFVLNPDGEPVGTLYHDAAPEDFVRFVQSRTR
jgi:cytochrome oxidase Cu insertion factor (SCO1/SenC/PrrC family)